MTLWYKRCPHGFKSVALRMAGLAVGSTLFQFCLAAAKVCWGLFDPCGKLSMLMESAQFKINWIRRERWI